jgi:transcriptional regulator with XRE-family HTH domain
MAARPEEDVLVAFGAAVRRARLTLAISQEELAGRAGLHRTYVGDIERGLRNVGLRNIQRLAEALSTSMADLLKDAEEPRSMNPVAHPDGRTAKE